SRWGRRLEGRAAGWSEPPSSRAPSGATGFALRLASAACRRRQPGQPPETSHDWTPLMYQGLKTKIEDKKALVGVIGLGYVGLPLIKAFTDAGLGTIGFDVDPHKVEKLQSGTSYIKHLPSEWVQGWLQSGRFEATANLKRLDEPDCLLVCVPTPLNASRD